MELNIVPNLYPDFSLLGKVDKFDFNRYPGFVYIWWFDGTELKLPLKIFEHCRFFVGEEKTALIRGRPMMDAKRENILDDKSRLKVTVSD